MSSATQVGIGGSVRLEAWKDILLSASKEVFAVMVGLPATDPENGDPAVLAEFTGMIGFAGALCGILSIRCSRRSASRIASKMLGIDVAEGSDSQTDAVGEMCNMIAGNFKASIPGLEDRCMLSVPTVVTGSEYELHSLAAGSRIDVAVLFENEPIWIGLEVRG